MSRKEHERSDVNARVILWILVGLVVFAIAAHAQIWFMFEYFRNINAARDVSPSRIQAGPPEPPAPRLQVNPTEDWSEYSRTQKEELNTYGWISRDGGRVRIPIERAMELLEEQGSAPPPESEKR